METEIVWTERASQSIEHIFEYISADSMYYAERYVTKLIISVDGQLTRLPLSGRFVPELAHTPFHYLREVIFGNYRVIYSAEKLPFSIVVITVVHAKQNLEKMPIENWVIQN
jgi:plasmid stabilization system protein ParE